MGIRKKYLHVNVDGKKIFNDSLPFMYLVPCLRQARNMSNIVASSVLNGCMYR